MVLNYSIAPAVENTVPPPYAFLLSIPKAWAWADQYRSNPVEGPVVDLSQGFPGTAPHQFVLDALSEAAKRGDVAKYGPILGAPELREAVAEEMRVLYRLKGVGGKAEGRLDAKKAADGNRDKELSDSLREDSSSTQGQGVTAEDVAITVGGNMAFLAVIMALCPPNTSSVLIPMPNYFSHAMSLSLQSVKSVHLACDPDDNFFPSLSAARAYLENTILDGSEASSPSGKGKDRVKPRMILLINPSNPTGAVMPPEVVKGWYALAKEYKIALVVDETYRDFVVGENDEVRGVPHKLYEEEDWRGTFISLGSFSKSYRIPGYRLGTITASPELHKRIVTICDCMQICAPRIAQVALPPLLPSLRPDLLASSQALAHRRTLFREIIDTVPGWTIESSGGYFAYVSFPSEYLTASSALGLKRKRLGSEDIAKGLAVRVGVIVLPGSFSMPDLEDDEEWEGVVGGQKLREDKWLRFAVANVDDQTIKEVGPRLRKFNEIMGLS